MSDATDLVQMMIQDRRPRKPHRKISLPNFPDVMTQRHTESCKMPNFIPYDPSQSKMVIINYADQLQPSTFEFAINHIIDNQLDLTVFHPRYKNEKVIPVWPRWIRNIK